MSVSPADVEHLVNRVDSQYATTEVALLALVAAAATTGDPNSPRWAAVKRQTAFVVRRQVETVVREHDAAVQILVAGLLVEAYRVGETAAAKDAPDTGVPVTMSAVAVRALVAGWTAQLGWQVRGTHQRMIKVAMGWYHQAVDDAADRAVVLGLGPTVTARVAATRAQQARFAGATMEYTPSKYPTPADDVKAVAQRVLTRAAERGVAGFVDENGRNFSLLSYVDHATRTATARAVTAGATRTWVNVGLVLAYVSVSPEGCKVCRPWETEIISLTDTIPDGLPVRVKGTLKEAIEAGLFHPHCTHRLRPYVHGEVTLPTRLPVNPNRDKQVARLRYLEAQTIIAKRERAAAVTPAAITAASARIRWRQAQIRDHVAATGLDRKRRHEQVR